MNRLNPKKREAVRKPVVEYTRKGRRVIEDVPQPTADAQEKGDKRGKDK